MRRAAAPKYWMRVSVERTQEAPPASSIDRFHAALTQPGSAKSRKAPRIGESPQAAVRPPEPPCQAEDELAARSLVDLREAETLEAIGEGSRDAALSGAPAVAAKGEQELGRGRRREIVRQERLPYALPRRARSRSGAARGSRLREARPRGREESTTPPAPRPVRQRARGASPRAPAGTPVPSSSAVCAVEPASGTGSATAGSGASSRSSASRRSC